MLITANLVISALALIANTPTVSATTENDVAAQAVLQQELARASNQSLLWGPYNPGLYFGLRPRIPNSFRAALMWTSVNDFADFQHGPRYQCKQEDGMKGYGWDEYDIRTGGKQVMHDVGNKVDIETSFVKVEGGEHGGSWAVRVKGTLHKDAPKDHKVSVVWHMAHPELEQIVLTTPPESDETGIKGPVKFKGRLPKLGDFHIEVTEGPKSNKYPSERDSLKQEWDFRPLDRTMYAAVGVPADHYWKGEGYLINNVQKHIQKIRDRMGDKPEADRPRPWQLFLLNNAYVNGNMHYVQKIFQGDFEFDILYSSDSSPEPMTSKILTKKIKENHEAFAERFSKVFKRLPPFKDSKYDEFSKALFSNLLGGIGYFYGDQIIDRSDADAYAEEDENFWEAISKAQETAGEEGRTLEGPSELFTSIPSRPFFPRGFLWDEGFHLLPIADWDMDVALQIIKSWLNQMDSDGWIAREQILGEEARQRVPAEFQVQHPTHANPPTLLMVLDKLLDKIEHQKLVVSANPGLKIPEPNANLPEAHVQHPELAIQFLKEIYPLLKRNHEWYRQTQGGEIVPYNRVAHSRTTAFRWRGRTPNHCLASGLDDYPRPQPPHPGELHVDLISWMGAYTRSLKRIAMAIGEKEDAATYLKYEMRISKNIDALHWNTEHNCFCDATYNEEEGQSEHVCHRGYVNLFPLMLETLDPYNEHLGLTMELMEDEEELWSEYGLRSLSKADPEYLTGENYWRGPIWININYLAIKALHNYASVGGPYQHRASVLYKKLRKAVVENVYKQWKETGYAWEQYDPATGKGQRTAHFTGWTSLVVEIMSMPETVGVKAKFVSDDADFVDNDIPEGHDEL